MREIFVLTGRTVKLYLKNPLSLLFSFVYLLLFIFLFALFLGDYMAKGMTEVYAGVQGMDFAHIRWLVDATAMAGVLMIGCILVPLNVLGIMVQDAAEQRLDSFLVSSASRGKLVFGYWLAPFLIGTALNTLCLFVIQGFLVLYGGQWMDVRSTLAMVGLIIANSFCATSILFVVAMWMKSASLYNTVTGMVSALVGFLTGAFLPIGVFPAAIQKFFALLPAHHGATLMRQVMTEAPLQAVFGGVTDQTVKDSFMTAREIAGIYAAENGITYSFGETQVAFPVMLAVVLGAGAVFLAVSIIRMRRYRKN